MVDDDDSDAEDESSGIGTEVLLSYARFAARAVSRRRWLVASVFTALALLTVTVVVLWPRTYRCESKLMAARNQVLETRAYDWSEALQGADDVILRRENLEAIIKQTDLPRLWRERRAFILRVKDAVVELLVGKQDEKSVMDSLIWTLETKLTVETSGTQLTISLDWPDAETSSRLVQAAEDSFLEARHVAEIATFSEYISILEGHATTLRAEVDTIAAQIQKLREDKMAAVKKEVGGAAAAAVPATVVHRVAPRAPAEAPQSDELPLLKTEIEAKKRSISELEDFRSRQLLEAQGKLLDLRGKYTDEHPSILAAKQAIQALSHESPQVTAQRTELRALEATLKQATVADQAASGLGTGYGAAAGAAAAAAGAGPTGVLPPEIMGLIQESSDDLNPAVAAQLRYAVDKYAALRSQISSARIDLDTAQAAFKHRYRIVEPAEVPLKPIKPKVPIILAGGLIAALLIALLSAVVAALRSGRIVETWQVQELALPVLAELRFPPKSTD